MSAFFAFLKKELLEACRSGKLTFLLILFFLFGVMNPAIAKLTPWLFEIMSESLEESGMVVTHVTVDALTSWTQFFKNIPMALIVFLLMYSGSFTKEYEKGTLIPILTKGLPRYKVVLSKALVMVTVWTVGYWLCFAVTYAYNAYFWDNAIAVHLASAVVNYWIFGLWTVCLSVLFSVLSKSFSAVLLGTGGCVLASYLLQQLPKLRTYMPTSLMNSASLLLGAEQPQDYTLSLILTATISVACVAISIPVMNKKQL
ncbi:MAG: ABC transporter permease subunit [Clostridia bacterium]|nr:ABC transporter permease subunit [Clostridia bacterium]